MSPDKTRTLFFGKSNVEKKIFLASGYRAGFFIERLGCKTAASLSHSQQDEPSYERLDTGLHPPCWLAERGAGSHFPTQHLHASFPVKEITFPAEDTHPNFGELTFGDKVHMVLQANTIFGQFCFC